MGKIIQKKGFKVFPKPAINKEPAGIGLNENNKIGFLLMYSIVPYTQRVSRLVQHSHKKIFCRNLVVSK